MIVEKVADIEKELGEAEVQALIVEVEFHEQKKHVDGLSKSIIHLVVKLGEADSHLALMCWMVEVTCQGEAWVIWNAKVEFTELEKNFQAEVKDLKAQADSFIQ